MRSTLVRYKIGLLVIGLFTIILLVLVLVQAHAAKQDNETYRAANEIVTKLNNYNLDHDKLPSSLAAAHITNVPASVSYQKLSEGSYKFCVTYKATSSDFDATSALSDVASGHYSSPSVSDSTEDSYYLYLPSSHHKGANCQTVKSFTTPSYDCSSYDSYSCYDNSTDQSFDNSFTQ